MRLRWSWIAILFVLLLSACAGGNTDDENKAPSEQTTVADAATETTQGAPTSTAGSGEGIDAASSELQRHLT